MSNPSDLSCTSKLPLCVSGQKTDLWWWNRSSQAGGDVLQENGTATNQTWTGLNTVWTDLSDRTHEDLYCKCDYSLTHRMTAFLSFSSIFYTAPTPPPHTHFRILQLNRGSLQIALWCIMWMQKSCHSSHTARYNMTLFESCVWSGDQQCNRGNPDSRLDITSNLLLTFSLFFPLPLLLVYLFIPISEHHVPREYFTWIFHYTLSLLHSLPLSLPPLPLLSLSVCTL